MTAPVQASAHAKAVANQAHGGFVHGDNDPAATDALRVDKAVRDRQYPCVGDAGETGRPMCEGWGNWIVAPTNPQREHSSITGGTGTMKAIYSPGQGVAAARRAGVRED